jgi:hypothetical protein
MPIKSPNKRRLKPALQVQQQNFQPAIWPAFFDQALRTKHYAPSTCDSTLRFSNAAHKKTRGSIPPGLMIRMQLVAN